jgi:hypothetical protein
MMQMQARANAFEERIAGELRRVINKYEKPRIIN